MLPLSGREAGNASEEIEAASRAVRVAAAAWAANPTIETRRALDAARAHEAALRREREATLRYGTVNRPLTTEEATALRVLAEAGAARADSATLLNVDAEAGLRAIKKLRSSEAPS